jgi:hypothetical protein
MDVDNDDEMIGSNVDNKDDMIITSNRIITSP